MIIFKSTTKNIYSKVQKSTSNASNSSKSFTPTVRIKAFSPFSNRTANVTGKKVVFEHVEFLKR